MATLVSNNAKRLADPSTLVLAVLIFPVNVDALNYANPSRQLERYAETIQQCIEIRLRMALQPSFDAQVCRSSDTLELLNYPVTSHTETRSI
jgi:hypothetical protein